MTWAPATATAAGRPLPGPVGLGQAPQRARRPGRPPRLGQRRVPGHRGRPGAAGQRRRRRHGADLGPPTGQQRAVLEGHQGWVNGVARSPWPDGSCWPAPAATARCGSGTPRPASSAPPWKATRAASGRSARSPWPGRNCWPAPATTARCGSGTPTPASSAPSWKATSASVWAVCPVTVAGEELLASAGSDGTVRIWDPATGQQRTTLEATSVRSTACARSPSPGRSCWPAPAATDGADLGPADRPAARHPARPPGRRLGGVPGHRRRDGNCWPAAAATARCGSGTPDTGQQHATLEGHQDWVCCRVPGHRRRTAAAGQRRRRRHGADLGPRNRPAARHPGRPPGRRLGGVPVTVAGTGAAGQRRRRRDGADLGPRKPASSAPPWRPPGRRLGGVPGHPGREAPAGQRRQRRHGADLGPGHRPAAAILEGHQGGVWRCARSPWPGSSAGQRRQ